MGGTKCLRLGTCEFEDMGGVLQNDSSLSAHSTSDFAAHLLSPEMPFSSYSGFAGLLVPSSMPVQPARGRGVVAPRLSSFRRFRPLLRHVLMFGVANARRRGRRAAPHRRRAPEQQ